MKVRVGFIVTEKVLEMDDNDREVKTRTIRNKEVECDQAVVWNKKI